MIKLIIFDIGGVIIDFSDEQFIRRVAGIKHIDWHELYETLMPLINRMHSGALKTHEAEAVVERRFGVHHWIALWIAMYKKRARRNEKVSKLINKLSKSYKIVLLTNINRNINIQSKRPLRGLNVERIFASCYLGMRKPEKRIYTYTLKKMVVKPSEALFIDNLEENVIGARSAGINAVRFTGYKHLVRSLRNFGIL